MIDNSLYGGFIVSKNVLKGLPIRYTFRSESEIENLNGWTIYSIDDDEEYIANPNNFEIVSMVTMYKIDPFLCSYSMHLMGPIFVGYMMMENVPVFMI